MNKLTVIGAGLAGCEAAWQAAERGIEVTLYEMKPNKMTPAHSSTGFAELICSNSFRSSQLTNAVGLLKEELRILGSLIMSAADATSVPAGAALAVDRTKFSEYVTKKINSHPNITVISQEVTAIPDDTVTIVASGPLTSDALSEYIEKQIGSLYLHFYDAAAPIVDAASLDMNKVFAASRYGKGEACYLNCPMSEQEYSAFYSELISAKEAPVHGVDGDIKVFEGCMPVEVMARRGVDTLRFGPLKPVGLPDPKTGKEAYAVVQLRQENADATMYNLVGFQTHLTFPEQRRVFSMIPGLENAEFLRYGKMHRNTFLDSPRLLDSSFSLKKNSAVFFAGQMTGTEGYVESAASGFCAGLAAAFDLLGIKRYDFENISVIGALSHYISDENIVNFQPMNANFGLVAPLGYKVKGGKAAKNEQLSHRSLEYIKKAADDISAAILK